MDEDAWLALISREIKGKAYKEPNGELAWRREDALQVVATLRDNQCRVLGVDIWRATPGGPEVLPYCMDMSDEPLAEAFRQAVWFIEGFDWASEDPDRAHPPLFNITAAFIGSQTRH